MISGIAGATSCRGGGDRRAPGFVGPRHPGRSTMAPASRSPAAAGHLVRRLPKALATGALARRRLRQRRGRACNGAGARMPGRMPPTCRKHQIGAERLRGAGRISMPSPPRCPRTDHHRAHRRGTGAVGDRACCRGQRGLRLTCRRSMRWAWPAQAGQDGTTTTSTCTTRTTPRRRVGPQAHSAQNVAAYAVFATYSPRMRKAISAARRGARTVNHNRRRGARRANGSARQGDRAPRHSYRGPCRHPASGTAVAAATLGLSTAPVPKDRQPRVAGGSQRRRHALALPRPWHRPGARAYAATGPSPPRHRRRRGEAGPAQLRGLLSSQPGARTARLRAALRPDSRMDNRQRRLGNTAPDPRMRHAAQDRAQVIAGCPRHPAIARSMDRRAGQRSQFDNAGSGACARRRRPRLRGARRRRAGAGQPRRPRDSRCAAPMHHFSKGQLGMRD